MDNRQWLEQQRDESGYTSVDPAPPAPHSAIQPDVDALTVQLMDTNLPMFQRMRAVFSLRNIGGEAAVEALAKAFHDPSALLRHEIAYVMGQMGDAHALPVLSQVLATETEHVMVRHEAAEALGAIGDESAREVLQKFALDAHPEVAESCVVALDLMDWVNSDDLEYTEW